MITSSRPSLKNRLPAQAFPFVVANENVLGLTRGVYSLRHPEKHSELLQLLTSSNYFSL